MAPRSRIVAWAALGCAALGLATCHDAQAPRAAWLVKAERLCWEEHQPAAAEALARAHLRDEALAARDRAAALGLLGFIAMEDYRNDEAQGLLTQAIQADKEAGLPDDEAEHVLELSSLLAQHLNQFQEADALLAANQTLLQRSPSTAAYALVQQALNQREQGHLSAVFTLLDQADQRVRDDSDAVDARSEIAKQRAWTLVLLGRLAEARLLFASSDPAATASAPAASAASEAQRKHRQCLRGRMLSTQGYLWSRVRQSLHPAHPRWAELDPRPALLEAARILSGCGLAGSHSNALTNLAHAAIGEGQAAAARAWLKDARAVMPHASNDLRLEWEELDGSVALAEHRYAAAQAHFLRISRETSRRGGPRSSQEMGWRALFGQALATLPTDPAAARRLFQAAERYLDQRSLELPLGNGRGTFLGLYERGTAAYVDLLLQQGQKAEALAVIRHARARGLLGLQVLRQVDRLTPAQRQGWEADLAAYARERATLDALAVRLDGAAQSEQARLGQKVQEGQGRLLTLLARALGHIGAGSADLAFPAPAPGEALLLCYPRGAPLGASPPGWWCFAADAGGTDVTEVKDEQKAEPLDERGLALAVQALAPRLSAARRVRVIAYGAMRHVDLAPETSQVLKEVVYALDLPWRRPVVAALPSGSPPRALVVYNPQGDAPATRRAGRLALDALRGAAWEVSEQGFERLGDYAGKPEGQRKLVGAALREALGRVDLFHYLGVGLFAKSGGWSHKLRTLDDAGLLVSDILALQRAPRFALLFGCDTGQSGEEIGSVEGLGLSQALVLKGSQWVIGTVRQISDEAAEAMTAALYERSQPPRRGAPARGLLAAEPDPVVLLREAQRGALAQRCLAQKLSEDPKAVAQDLAAFRVFVP